MIARWRLIEPSRAHDRVQIARDIAETVLGQIQRRLDAPVLLSATSGESALSQTLEPISFVEARERLAGVEWLDSSGRLRLVTDQGEIVEPEMPAPRKRPANLASMDESRKKRRPATAHVRPGRGGKQQRRLEDAVDPTRGLEAYGETVWWMVSGGAMLGLIEIEAEGNSVAWCRLSGDDSGETIDGQMKPIMALANRQDEIAVRFALLAIDMPGWRDVALDRSLLTDDSPCRDDVLQIADWLKEGWLENVVLRDQRRLARDTLSGEQIIRFLERKRVGLWFADAGRRMDYVADRSMLRFYNVISAEDRDNLTRRTQLARIDKGPLAGRGWGPVPFGFYRGPGGRPKQDPEQWPFILRAFELADALGADDPSKCSISAIRALLEQEGCPFSRPTVARILRSTIYATGEWTVKVKGIAVSQDPVPLTNPVPIARFQRVQELLSLRKGKNSAIELGDCLLNTVEAVHSRCMAETALRIKGYRQGTMVDIVYRHRGGAIPDSCRSGGRNHRGGFSWLRDEIDPVLARAVRDLASHPEVLRQAELAARHTNAPSSARLTAEQREALENDGEAIAVQLDRLADEWVDTAIRAGDDVDLHGYSRVSTALKRKLRAIETRLANDALEAERAAALEGAKKKDRVHTFLEIMSEETPTDPFLKQLRARLFQRVVSRVIIEDDGEGPINLIIEGHLVPEDTPAGGGNPVLASADLLDAYETRKAGELPPAERKLADEAALRGEMATVSEEVSSETVATLYDRFLLMRSGVAVRSLTQQRLDHEGWRLRVAHREATGTASWRVSIPAAVSSRRPFDGTAADD